MIAPMPLAATGSLRRVSRFSRTPKGLLLVILAAISALAVRQEGAEVALPGLAAAIAAGVAVDVPLLRINRGRWTFPAAGILTAMIVALVLSPAEPWPVPVLTTVAAVTSKHVFRTRLANVFNPAALGLVVAGAFFGSGQSWWGALPDAGPVSVLVLLAAGWFVADRINKGPLVLVFLGVHFLLFAVASFVGSGTVVGEIFRAPDLQAALFFAFFMLDDPPTCPVRYRDQAIFAVVVAGASFWVFEQFGAVYFLPAGLLAGNVYEAVRKSWPRRRPVLRSAA